MLLWNVALHTVQKKKKKKNRNKKIKTWRRALLESQGKYLFRKSKVGSLHQQLKTGTTGINDFDTSSRKKIIYRRNTKCTTGRKAISVCKTVEKNYTPPRGFINSEGVPDTIHKSPSSRETSGPGNIKFGKKGAVQKAETGQQSFWATSKKRAVINLNSQYMHPLQAL